MLLDATGVDLRPVAQKIFETDEFMHAGRSIHPRRRARGDGEWPACHSGIRILTLPFDAASLASATLALVCAFAVATDRLRPTWAVGLVLGAAFIIRADAAAQFSLHAWDERFHAVVAKHLMQHPLRPTLFPIGHPEVASDWMHADVWLHKPPLAMWMMAASMSLAGVNELAMRAPSVLLGTIAVWLTYRIALRVGGLSLAILAAYFHAVNGFLVGLSAGRRVADHVDVALLVCVEAGVLAIVSARPGPTRGFFVGAATGLAILSKSLPGALTLGLLLVAQRQRYRERFVEVAVAAGAAMTVTLPWFLYVANRYPEASRQEWTYTLQHLGVVVEGHTGPWWFYLADAPRSFGEQLPIALLLGALALRERPWSMLVAAWIVVPYVIFSAAKTKLPNMVMVAAPAAFLVNAAAVDALRSWAPTGAILGWFRWTALLVFVLLPTRSLLEPHGPLERRDRFPEHAQAYRSLSATVPTGTTHVFNVPDPVTAMFYTDLIVVGRRPTEAEVRKLQQDKRPVVVVRQGLSEVPMPASWHVTTVPWPVFSP